MRSAIRVLVAAAVLAALPSLAIAGWRSSDRRQLDEEVVVEEPSHHHDETPFDPGDGHAPMHGNGHDDRHHQGHDHQHHHVDRMPRSQPYWGTMRPYWNAPEPPGVIHRQPRTAPLKVPKR